MSLILYSKHVKKCLRCSGKIPKNLFQSVEKKTQKRCKKVTFSRVYGELPGTLVSPLIWIAAWHRARRVPGCERAVAAQSIQTPRQQCRIPHQIWDLWWRTSKCPSHPQPTHFVSLPATFFFWIDSELNFSHFPPAMRVQVVCIWNSGVPTHNTSYGQKQCRHSQQ